MREIEFRGKSTKTTEWEYGSYDKATDGKSFIVSVGKDQISHIAYIREVKEETVGQFTGSRDKNKIKIYEGDIIEGTIRSQWVKRKIRCVVKWNKDEWICAEPDGENYWAHKVLFGKDCIVIGNIYDNPELLGE